MDRMRARLDEWARWCERYHQGLGYPSRSAVCATGGVSQSFDDMCDAADASQCQTVDVCVHDLEPIERAAVMRCYGLASVFRFPRENYADVLDRAHTNLRTSFSRRGVDIG